MSQLESSNPTTVGPEKYNIVEAQVKDLKIGLMNMSEILKGEMSRMIKEIYENIDSKRKQRKQIKTCSGNRINKETQTEKKLELRGSNRNFRGKLH